MGYGRRESREPRCARLQVGAPAPPRLRSGSAAFDRRAANRFLPVVQRGPQRGYSSAEDAESLGTFAFGGGLAFASVEVLFGNLFGEGVRHLGKDFGGRGSRGGLHDRGPLITPFADEAVDRYLAKEGGVGKLRDLLTAAAALV